MAVTVAGLVESVRTDTSDPMTWSHNSGTASPQGVVVAIMHGDSTTDHVVSVTYGSASLTRIQRNTDGTTEPGASELWFAGESIPTGTQTVTVELSSGTTEDIHGVSITLDGDRDLAILDKGGIDGNQANPSTALVNTSGSSAMAFAAFYSGLSTIASITAGASCTLATTGELAGNFTSCVIRQTTASTTNFTVAATSGTDDVAWSAILVQEKPVPPVPRTRASHLGSVAATWGTVVIAPLMAAVLMQEAAVPSVPAIPYSEMNRTWIPSLSVAPTWDTQVTRKAPILNVWAIPTTASLTTTGYAPTVSTTAHQSVTPSTATLTTTGYAPTVTASDHQSVTPSTASLLTTTYAPTVTASDHKTVTPTTATLTTTGYAPTVTTTAHQSVTPDPASLTTTGHAPTVTATANQSVTPSTATLTTTGYAPTVSATANQTVTPSTATLTTTGYAPTVTTSGNQSVTPGIATLTTTGYAPTVTASDHQTVTPSTATLTTTGHAPTVTASDHQTVTPTTATLTTTGYAPTVSVSEVVYTPPRVKLDAILAQWHNTTTLPLWQAALYQDTAAVVSDNPPPKRPWPAAITDAWEPKPLLPVWGWRIAQDEAQPFRRDSIWVLYASWPSPDWETQVTRKVPRPADASVSVTPLVATLTLTTYAPTVVSSGSTIFLRPIAPIMSARRRRGIRR